MRNVVGGWISGPIPFKHRFTAIELMIRKLVGISCKFILQLVGVCGNVAKVVFCHHLCLFSC